MTLSRFPVCMAVMSDVEPHLITYVDYGAREK
jgi:hypothetical protein